MINIQTSSCTSSGPFTSTNPLAYGFPLDLHSFDPALTAGLRDTSILLSSLDAGASAKSNHGTYSQHGAAGQVYSQVGVSTASQGAQTAGQPHMQQGVSDSSKETETFMRLLLLLAGQVQAQKTSMPVHQPQPHYPSPNSAPHSFIASMSDNIDNSWSPGGATQSCYPGFDIDPETLRLLEAYVAGQQYTTTASNASANVDPSASFIPDSTVPGYLGFSAQAAAGHDGHDGEAILGASGASLSMFEFDPAVQNQLFDFGVLVDATATITDSDAVTRAQQRPGAHATFAASESAYTPACATTVTSNQDGMMEGNGMGKMREQGGRSGSRVRSAGGAQGAPVPVRTEVRVGADGTISRDSVDELRRLALARGMDARQVDEMLGVWVERKQKEVMKTRAAVPASKGSSGKAHGLRRTRSGEGRKKTAENVKGALEVRVKGEMVRRRALVGATSRRVADAQGCSPMVQGWGGLAGMDAMSVWVC